VLKRRIRSKRAWELGSSIITIGYGSDGLRSLVATMLLYSLLSDLGGRVDTSGNRHSYQRRFGVDRSRSGSLPVIIIPSYLACGQAVEFHVWKRVFHGVCNPGIVAHTLA
jgi:hypothetical protein